MLARDLTALCGQIPPVLLSFGHGCEVAALHLLSLPLVGVVLVDPDFGAVDRRIAEGLLVVPVPLVTLRERGEEEGRRRKDGEARKGTVHFDEALVDFCGAGPFGCKAERIDEKDGSERNRRLLEVLSILLLYSCDHRRFRQPNFFLPFPVLAHCCSTVRASLVSLLGGETFAK